MIKMNTVCALVVFRLYVVSSTSYLGKPSVVAVLVSTWPVMCVADLCNTSGLV